MNNDIQIQSIHDEPSLKIQIFKNRNHVDLKFKRDSFEILDMEGNQLLTDVKHNDLWRVKVKRARPA